MVSPGVSRTSWLVLASSFSMCPIIQTGEECVLLTLLSKAKGGRWAQCPRLSLPSLPLEPHVLLSQPSVGLGGPCLDASLGVWLPVASAERAEGRLVMLGVQCWSPPGQCPLRSFVSPGPGTY